MSNRVTKELASEIASKLLKDKQKVVDNLHKEYTDFLFEEYNKTIPKEISEFDKKHPGWIRKTSSINFSGYGFNWENVYFSQGQYVLTDRNGNSKIELTSKLADKIKTLKNSWEKERKSVGDLRQQIEIAIYNLRTFNQVEKNFPEAAAHLPAGGKTMSLTINLDKIRSQLK